MKLWNQFANQQVQTLAWALLSPPLIQDMGGNLPTDKESILAFLASCDNNPDKLTQHLAQCNSHRLGYYFEALWEFYLSHHPDYQLIAHNLQVNDTHRRTLGAFDFIYRHLPTNEVHHLEVAVKFYLFTGNTTDKGTVNDQSLWPGPNPEDNLGTKALRLTDHQLPLSGTPEGIAAIEQAGAGKLAQASPVQAYPVQASAALKGYLFYPWDKPAATPLWAPPQHCQGHWAPIAQLKEICAQYTDGYWRILPKREWLGEMTNLVDTGLPNPQVFSNAIIDTKTLGEQLPKQLSHYPIMVARVESNVGQNEAAFAKGVKFNEVERFFITPPSWPCKE